MQRPPHRWAALYKLPSGITPTGSSTGITSVAGSDTIGSNMYDYTYELST